MIELSRSKYEEAIGMALVNCPECGKEFSNKAQACPNCARPVDAFNTSSQQITPINKEYKGVACSISTNGEHITFKQLVNK